MSSRHLAAFVTVAETGQFTVAARRLHVSQPALSRTVQELEEQLGTTLFRRRPSGVELTDSGELLLASAQTALRRLEEALGAGVARGVDIRHLRAFVAVADAGSLSEAARRLGVAQSAVSRTVTQLEAQHGRPLFARERGGMTLTGAGRELLAPARGALAALDHALDSVHAAVSPLDGQLTIGILPQTVPQVTGALEAFRRTHPRVNIEFRLLDFARQVRELLAGELDAEFMIFAPDNSLLVLQEVFRSPLMIVMSSSHRLAGRRSLRFEDIADETMPGLHPSASEEWADLMWLTERRGRRPRVTEETPLTPEEIWPLLASGRAISTTPAFLVPSLIAPTGLVAVPLEDVDPFRIWLAHRRDDTNPLVQELARLASAVITQTA